MSSCQPLGNLSPKEKQAVECHPLLYKRLNACPAYSVCTVTRTTVPRTYRALRLCTPLRCAYNALSYPTDSATLDHPPDGYHSPWCLYYLMGYTLEMISDNWRR